MSSTVGAQTAEQTDTSVMRTQTARTPTVLTLGAMAIGVLTRAAPAYDGRTFTELQVTQPMLSMQATRASLTLNGLLNAEGYTLRRGELNAGIWGEGYVDRRHPHTLVHEAMLTWMPIAPRRTPNRLSLSMSVAGGRGFVAFGSDDPMMRPFEKYPVNHHHAQILERIQTIGALQIDRGEQSVTLEVTAFNGDEPAGPFHGPRWNRFGDSWAVRGTVRPKPAIELSWSEASVISPELQQGGAFDHRQHHASIRLERNVASGARYLLAEWARTDERTDGRTAFRYRSLLAEGVYGWRGASVAARIERTDRAEQGRLADPFRSPVGHVDFQILGVTQWTVGTVAIQSPSIRLATVGGAAPFLEVSRAVPEARRKPSAFEAAAFYGAERLWSVSAGVRLALGSMRARMGRYGVLKGVDHTGIRHHAM